MTEDFRKYLKKKIVRVLRSCKHKSSILMCMSRKKKKKNRIASNQITYFVENFSYTIDNQVGECYFFFFQSESFMFCFYFIGYLFGLLYALMSIVVYFVADTYRT